jgi:exonuclease III
MTRFLALNVSGRTQPNLDCMAEKIRCHGPDVVVLSEVGNCWADTWKTRLRSFGLEPFDWNAGRSAHDRTVLVASRLRIDPIEFSYGFPHRAKALKLPTVGVTMLACYVWTHHDAEKLPMWRWIVETVESLQCPWLLMGDLNTGGRADRSTNGKFKGTEFFDRAAGHLGVDLWRLHNGQSCEYSHFKQGSKSGKETGWRIDHAIGSREIADRCSCFRYDHDFRKPGLTDHSAIIVELDGESKDAASSLSARALQSDAPNPFPPFSQ